MFVLYRVWGCGMQGLPRAVYRRKWGALHVADPIAQPPCAHSYLRLENVKTTRSVVVKGMSHPLEDSQSDPTD